ncbi:cupin domain-containing protein [Nocardioides sp.]|uniref:cupin domain-containing protein n=1 Tax=Nocardioides sp. TaxID=35761 RepID=UPI0027371EBC|nr:cupin domain-containing protein [Nocardioides sp.]MDP3894226.1 cupin domain-containing protein [Nocardioides sp.]
MQHESLTDLVTQHLSKAKESSAGRSAHTVYGGHERSLRQTVIALRADARLDDHESPGDATLQVLAGRVVLTWGSERQEGATGDLLAIPGERHALEATEDSVVLLTVAKRD